MDRVHDYESCGIGSIPIMSVFARIVQWREHGSSKAMILVRFQVWVFIFGEVAEMDYRTSPENWQPSVMAVRGFESHPLRLLYVVVTVRSIKLATPSLLTL